MRNGFRNRRGREVAHRDLIERALRLEGEVLETGGRVEWVWEPRGRVGVAYRLVSVVLDEMEPGYVDSESDAPIRTIWEKGGL